MRRDGYGASALHLATHLLAFGAAGYALAQVIRSSGAISFLIWLLLAAVGHDLLLLPVYSMLDRVAVRGVSRATRDPRLLNHIRAPALLSGLLFLVYFPLILGLSSRPYFLASGRHAGLPYARNWAGVTVALFAASAAVYVVRCRRARP